MISCKECKERLYPTDPSTPSGIYHHSTCDYYCAKPSYYRELEAKQLEPREKIVIHRHSNMSQNEYALLRNLEGQVKYLQGKLMERQARKQVKTSGYKGIK